mmetsp:Transcript_7717/g.21070  ORF Transcript_7717/g.21070 Transcript_7717/m.21070 type:complete len:335 (-) Transcript_7717:3371-4375(-)
MENWTHQKAAEASLSGARAVLGLQALPDRRAVGLLRPCFHLKHTTGTLSIAGGVAFIETRVARLDGGKQLLLRHFQGRPRRQINGANTRMRSGESFRRQMDTLRQREEVFAPIETDELGETTDRDSTATRGKLEQVLQLVLSSIRCPLPYRLPEPSHLMAVRGEPSRARVPLPIRHADISSPGKELGQLLRSEHAPSIRKDLGRYRHAETLQHRLDRTTEGSAQSPVDKSGDKFVLRRLSDRAGLATSRERYLRDRERSKFQRLRRLFCPWQCVLWVHQRSERLELRVHNNCFAVASAAERIRERHVVAQQTHVVRQQPLHLVSVQLLVNAGEL